MKLVSGIVDSGFFAQSALSAEVATKDSLGRNISETYLTGVDIPESANWNGTTTVVNNNSAIWNNATNIVSSNSASWGASNPQIPVTGINGIKISESGDKVVFEVSGDYADKDWVTAQGYLTAETDWTDTITAASANAYEQATAAIPPAFDPSYISAQVDTKLDSAIYAADSGTFLTGLPQDLVYTADIADMATTGDINDLVTIIAETYQPKLSFDYNEDSAISAINGSALAGGSNTSGNYIPYTGIESSLSAFTTNSGLRIQRTVVGGGLNSNYMSDNTLQIRYINGTSTNNVSVLSNSQLKFETTNDNAYVDREKIHKWDSASDYIQNNSATISEVNTSYRTNSGNYLTAIPDTYLQNTDLTITDGKISEISGVPLSAGSTPTYEYTDNNLISAIDTSGLYATSGSANHLNQGGTMGANIIQSLGIGNNFIYMPKNSPWGSTVTGIFSPLQFATGACLAMDGGSFAAFLKGNEWYVSNRSIGQALRGETHQTRGVHISGATTAGYGFNLGILSVSGVNSTGSWKYGYKEDAALRAVSSCDMHESAFGYDANNKISGYNGSAFAGGSDVPEGVMVESGLEYNAVNEISGYNGSAIAQYGAEKQWLVHDDTLVHASNSAQYALGVNLSAVAQLLGVDETVLWEGSAPLDQSCLVNGTRETATLSEPLSSFNKIRIYAVWNTYLGNFEGCSTFEYPGTNVKGGYIMNDCTNQGFIAGGIWSANGTTFKLIKHWQAQYPGVKDASTNYGGIFKVVGIGRRSNT